MLHFECYPEHYYHNATMLKVILRCFNSECRYSEWHYDECYCTLSTLVVDFQLRSFFTVSQVFAKKFFLGWYDLILLRSSYDNYCKKLACSGNTVVERLPQHSKVAGLSPVTISITEREKKRQIVIDIVTLAPLPSK
jgi:hypothetical protein